VKRLARGQIWLLHARLLEATGGAAGVRDQGLLDSAVEAPYSGFGETEFYPTVEAKAARLAFGLVSDHPFIDGNKRTGILAMLVLLDINSVALTTTDDELVALGLGLAKGEIDTTDVARWIAERVPEETGRDRPDDQP
jgi:death-on-curing protein